MADRTDNVFPQLVQDGYELSQIVGGLTKREYFAAIAMQAILSNPSVDLGPFEDIAADAVLMSDKLIAALNREIPE